MHSPSIAAAALHAAPTAASTGSGSSGAGLGAAVLMLMLAAGIVVGLKSKRLTVTELVVCGGFGLLLGTTTVGAALRGPLGSLGSAILAAVS